MNANEPNGCGLWRYWWFKGPFIGCCNIHDARYHTMLLEACSLTLWEVDTELLRCMRRHAGKNPLRYIQAYAMFAIAHLFGLIRWRGRRYLRSDNVL